MEPHVHASPTMAIMIVLFCVAVFGTLHLLSLTFDNRATRAYLSLGF